MLLFYRCINIDSIKTDVTWNSDDESLVASTTGQPRGDCPYSNNLDFCRGCAPVPALDLDDRRNSIHVTSVCNLKLALIALVICIKTNQNPERQEAA